MKNYILLGLDTSHQQGLVCLFDAEKIFYAKTIQQKNDHAKNICALIDSAQKIAQEKNLVIDGVVVGLGPGSFVGIRVALATAHGYSLALNKPLMGVCSHKLLFASLKNPKLNDCLMMKASGNLFYKSKRPKNFSDELEITIHNLSDEKNSNLDQKNIFSDQKNLIADHFSSDKNIYEILGPSAEGMQKVALEKIAKEGGFKDESQVIKPNYIKPPNIFKKSS